MEFHSQHMPFACSLQGLERQRLQPYIQLRVSKIVVVVAATFFLSNTQPKADTRARRGFEPCQEVGGTANGPLQGVGGTANGWPWREPCGIPGRETVARC